MQLSLRWTRLPGRCSSNLGAFVHQRQGDDPYVHRAQGYQYHSCLLERARIGTSHGLFHRPPVPILSPTPCHRPCPQRARAQRGPPGSGPCWLKRGTDTNATLKEGASSYGRVVPARCAEARGSTAARGDKAPMLRVVCPRSRRYNAFSTGLASAGDVTFPRIAPRSRRHDHAIRR